MSGRFWLERQLGADGAVLALFVLFIAVRAALCLLPLEPFSDAAWYVNRARAIADGAGYSEGGVPTAFWPPGWPLLLGGLFKLFGESIAVVKGFNLVCAVIGAWFTLDLGRRLFGSELAGRAALLIVALYPNHAAYVPVALTEVFYTTLVLAGCWLVIARPGKLALPLAGLAFGYSMLVKAQSLILVPTLFAVALLHDGLSWRAFWQRTQQGLLVLVFAFAVVLPWTLRNHAVLGEWVLVSTNGGITLLTGNNPSARGDYTPDDPLVTSVPRTVATQVETDREYKLRAVAWIRENPAAFLKLMPSKLYRLWAPDGEAEWAFQAGFAQYDEWSIWFRTMRWLNQGYYVAMLAGFAWAGWLLATSRAHIGTRRVGWWLLPYGVALYPSLIAVVFSGQSRFHYPVMPFVAMACGWLVTRHASPQLLVQRRGDLPATLSRRLPTARETAPR